MVFFVQYLIVLLGGLIPILGFAVGLIYLCSYLEEKFRKIVPFTVLVVTIFIVGLPFYKWIDFLINKVIAQ